MNQRFSTTILPRSFAVSTVLPFIVIAEKTGLEATLVWAEAVIASMTIAMQEIKYFMNPL